MPTAGDHGNPRQWLGSPEVMREEEDGICSTADVAVDRDDQHFIRAGVGLADGGPPASCVGFRGVGSSDEPSGRGGLKRRDSDSPAL